MPSIINPTTLLVALLSATSTVAQKGYTGTITTEGIGNCPLTQHAENHIAYTWEPTNGSVCVELGRPYADGYHAGLFGEVETPESVKPPHFGGCRDSKCTDCTLVDIEYGDEPGLIKVDCLELKDAPYLFVGVGKN
ncbi:hypothetical protein P170DRAFT_441207 [Aspergillus steynii IBT 23096]|uniref:Uncharacterized protein n=1 Tax=Aspergillus steynii IBT 23096 TaxID=1392250 RepID=A0A2I2FT25_9EURO|nr:uncharacterized protein P170DRAFT_441207 [Aspergillus steynii IBT 23096]PLB43761.1 hypothetical protein P170DRAFT_441207 [Aspergillus steynii IBT 23096]